MKRLFTYIAIAAAMLAVSCNQEIKTDAPGACGFTIQVFSTDPTTRAGNPDSEYNEDLIDHFDYFFYEDAAGTTPIYPHARVNGSSKEFLTDIGDPFELLREGGYVYIVANYPELIGAEVQTLEQVLALPVSTDFQKDYANKNPKGFIMDNLGGNGTLTRFQANGSNDHTVVNIGLSRLAFKTTLVINVAESVAGAGDEVWTPQIDDEHLSIYFVNADSTNTMAAAPVRRADDTAEETGHFTYATSHGYTKSGYTVSTDPSYSYPQSWSTGDNGEPYYKIQLGWVSNKTGLAPYYYKVPVPVSAQNGVFTLNRNTWYQLTLDLKVLGGTKEDYVLVDKYYCVADFADWSSPSDIFGTTNDSAHYFDVPTLNYNIYSTQTLDINFISDASALAEITSIEYYNYGGSGSALVRRSPADGSYAEASTATTYPHPDENRDYKLTVDGDNKVVKFEHDISNLYTVRTIKVRIYKDTEQTIYRDVTIYQHPAIELKKAAAGNVFVNGRFARVSDAVDRAGNSLGVAWTSNNTTFYHSRNNWNAGGGYMGGSARIDGGDYSGSGYGSISGGGVAGDISSDFFTTEINITAFNDGSENEDDKNDTYEYRQTDNTSFPTNTTSMELKEADYRIGDPRKPAASVFSDWSLLDFLYDENGTTELTEAWDNPGSIQVCGTDELTKSVIAPHFLVSSALNLLQTGIYFENAVRRGATYQEAGFPAGRWRLPTEAEVAFIIARQTDGTLPHLFDSGTIYWAGSGRVIQVRDNTVCFRNAAENETVRCRFVYDLWYWGDQPASGDYSQNQYHPNGHEVSYK